MIDASKFMVQYDSVRTTTLQLQFAFCQSFPISSIITSTFEVSDTHIDDKLGLSSNGRLQLASCLGTLEHGSLGGLLCPYLRAAGDSRIYSFC
jgi:hypothetical protein